MSSTSFRHLVNKENPVDIFTSGKGLMNNENGNPKVLGLKSISQASMKNENNVLSLTPSLKLGVKEQVNGVNLKENVSKNRRALGDLINTTRQTATPKLQNSKLMNTPLVSKTPLATKTPSNNKVEKGLFNEAKPKPQLNDEMYPPVERFHPPLCDTFDDLFENGEKLSNLFVNRNVKFVPQLPVCKQNANSMSGSHENLNKFEILDESEWKKTNKKLKKTMKKQINQQVELIPHELPDLDDILFKIPKDLI